MSFLAPWFLLGALAIAGPVLFHLIRRTTRDKTPFPSLLFLRPSPPRFTRKSRLQHLLLLALRSLVLAALALGFARPYFRNPAPRATGAAVGNLTVLLVDTSASMRRTGLAGAARAKAAKWISESGPADRLALVTFDREPVTRFSFAQWSATPVPDRAAVARAALDGTTPGWASSRLGPALIRAAEEFTGDEAAAAATRRRVVLIGDLQEGSNLEPLQSFEWPPGIEVVPDPVRTASPGNAGIHPLAEPADAELGIAPAVRIRVVNSPDSRHEQFQVGWIGPGAPGPLVAPIDVYVPPGQSRIVSIATPTNTAGFDRIGLRGDDEPFDDTVHLKPPVPRAIELLHIGNDAPADPRQPLYFLRRALPDSRRQVVHLATAKSTDPLSADLVSKAGLVIVTGQPGEASVDVLRRGMEAGATVLFAPSSATECGALGRWVGVPALGATEFKPSGYAMLGELDFRHPLLAAFADPRFGDFTPIHFWRYRKLTEPLPAAAKVVARFDSGDPAWIDFPVGRGRLVFAASGWTPGDSQFALSSKFVPWIHGLLELAGSGAAPVRYPVVGDAIPLPTGRTADLAVRRPDGAISTLRPDAVRFEGTTEPGIYTLGSGAEAREIAVNLDPAESRTAPLATDDLEKLGVHVGHPETVGKVVPTDPEVPQAAESEGRQKLWRWLLVGTLGLLFVETVLAGRTASPNPAPREAIP